MLKKIDKYFLKQCNYINTMTKYFIFFILIIGFWLNFYKLELLAELMQKESKTYNIFPWKCYQKAVSDISWIYIHLFISLWTMLFSAIRTLHFKNANLNTLIESTFLFLLVLFICLILVNIYHIGQTSFYTALMVDNVPLILLTFAYLFNKKTLLFYILTFPVMIEFVLYIVSLLV